jgi:hypothetical protein
MMSVAPDTAAELISAERAELVSRAIGDCRPCRERR